MNYINNFLFSVIFSGFIIGFISCTDEAISPEPPDEEEIPVDPNIPQEIRDGFSISFNMSLEQFGGNEAATRVTNTDLMEIDNFVDLEKVRILFFVCAKENGQETVADTTHSVGRYVKTDLPYMTGEHDYFLFESKSRWVSKLSDEETTSANWQVTAPVFTYGNNDEYRWDDIRYALTHFPFKVVVLANRPDVVNFGNFDDKFGGDISFPTGRGPNWGPSQTWVPVERRTKTGDSSIDWNNQPTINDLHHCQWDVVYSSKNSGDKNTYAGLGVYSFIMKNPTPEKHGPVPQPDPYDLTDPIHQTNMMGALSNWTIKEADGITWYHLPNKEQQGIPMYGCQVFDPISDWSEGTPYNISDRHMSQSGSYIRKNIFLLRSLAKVELKIPKIMKKNGEEVEIELREPTLCYSNVMARCEPLDVATPTERLWHEENWNNDLYCEWKNIFDYGPIIREATPTVSNPVDFIQSRMAWFYGAWKDWWHFNSNRSDGLNPTSDYFNYNAEYPRIYNPVIQRNANGRIDRCLIEDEDYLYFVVYTGERNINDPTTFGTSESFNAAKAEFAYFKFTIDGTTYCLPLTDYSTNSSIKNYYTSTTSIGNYRSPMATGNKSDWNWPLLRNHVYTFTVKSLGDFSDTGDGLNVQVVSSEKRYAPDIWFN